MRGAHRITSVAFMLGLSWAGACRSFAVDRPAERDEPDATTAGASDSGLADRGAPLAKWCADRDAAFCSDFDSDPFLAEWTEQTTTGGGQLSPEPTSYRSSPRAVSASATKSDSGEERARICRGFARTSELHVAFDIRADLIDPTSETSVVSIRGSAGSQSSYLDVIAHAGSWEISWQATGGAEDVSHRVPLNAQPAAGTWARMKLDLVTTPAGGSDTDDHIVVQVGSGVAGDSTFTLPAIDGAIQVCLGVTYAVNVSDTWRFLFDNVLVDTKPVD